MSTTLQEVCTVQRKGPNANEDLVLTGLRYGDVAELENFGSARLGDYYCTHGFGNLREKRETRERRRGVLK
jgi:hypothetical protein